MMPTDLDDLLIAAAKFIGENGQLEESVSKVANLRDNVKDLAGAGDIQQREIVEPLEHYHNRIDAIPDRDSEAEGYRQQLAAKLADAYGTLGGLLRKLDKREKSLASYTAGAKLERDRRNLISASYNLTNKINLTLLLHPERITDQALKDEVKETLTRLRQRVDMPGGSDYWTNADCGLLALLADESGLANDYYARLSKSAGVEDWKYRSTSGMLLALSAALAPFKPELAARMRTEADRLTRKI